MTTTVGALFHNGNEAENAIHALRDAGLPKSSLRIFEDAKALSRCLDGKKYGTFNWKIIIVATLVGAVVFGTVGLMAAVDDFRFGITELSGSVALLVIFTVIGALIGAFLGLFLGYNDCECDTYLYREGVRQGGVVVVVETQGGQTVTVLNVLGDAHGTGMKVCGQGGGH